MAFVTNRGLALLFFLSLSSSSPPFISEHPQDWNEDAAFSGINVTRTAPAGSARFSCRTSGSPPPSVSWFAALRGADFRPVDANSSQFLLLGSDLVVRSAELVEPVVFCEASSPEGRVRSRSARFRKWGRMNPMVRSYMNPTWLSRSHALVVCADRSDYVTEERTPEGATIHKLRAWGDVYSYGAYYDDHSATNNKQDFLSADTRSDIYWHGPFIVISTNVTHYKDVLNIFFCQQVWSPHFIVGTQQKPEDYMHGDKKYPSTGGLYVRYPFLHKRIYTHTKPDPKLPEVSVRLFSANSEGFVVGKNVTIDCLTLSHDPGLQITWLRYQRPVGASPARVRSEPIAFFGQRLVISDLRAADAGNYTCTVTGGGAEHAATIAVEPRLPLVLALAPSPPNVTRVVEEGSRLALECRFRGPPREVQWLFNGSSARGRRSHSPGRSRLTLTDLEAGRDDGCFQCALHEAAAFSVRTAACLRLRPPRPLPPLISVATRGAALRVHRNGSLAGPPVLVTVTDEEAGRGGRIASCALVLGNASQPLPAALSLRNVAAFRLEALQLPGDQQRLRLECRDANRPPASTSILVTIERCPARCPPPPQEGDDLTRRLLRLLGAALTPRSVDAWLRDLGRLTREAERTGVAAADFDLFLSVLRAAVRSPAMSERLGQVVTHLSRLLGAYKPQQDSNPARRLSAKVLNLTEAVAAALPTPGRPGEALVLRSPRLSVAVLRLPPRPLRTPGAVAHFLVPPGQDTSRAFAATAANSAFPAGSFGLALSQAAVTGDRVEFAMAARSDVFRVLGNRLDGSKAPQVPASPIVSATADLAEQSESPVALSLPPPTASGRADALCAFWDFWAQRWSSRGCSKASGGGAFVLCRCRHLTNFALLLDVDRATAVSGRHQLVLSVLSYALLTVSAAFLLLTVAIYAAFLHRETRRMSSGHSSSSRESRITASRVLLSLCAALLLATTVFLGGSHYNRPGPLCTLVGVLLHYFYLAVFFWSVVEAAHICITVIYVSLKSNQISIHVSRFFLKASIFAWGVPLVIIAVTVGVNSAANYGTDLGADYRFCFLARGPFFAAFLAPMLLCLAANITILVLLAVVLRRYAYASKAKGPGEKRSQWRQHVVGFVGICFILNVTWIIGALQVRAAKLPLQYLHVLVNGLQGLFIFVFYCLLRSDILSFVRKSARRAFGAEEKPSATSRTATSESNSMITSGERRAHRHEASGATKTELLSASAALPEEKVIV